MVYLTILYDLSPSCLQVVTTCFSDTLDPDYRTAISRFTDCYMALGIRVTSKVHTVFHHVAEFCDSRKCDLGPWSEQCTESVHHDFVQLWEDYKVKSYNHLNFKTKFLAAVSIYNSRHMWTFETIRFLSSPRITNDYRPTISYIFTHVLSKRCSCTLRFGSHCF